MVTSYAQLSRNRHHIYSHARTIQTPSQQWNIPLGRFEVSNALTDSSDAIASNCTACFLKSSLISRFCSRHSCSVYHYSLSLNPSLQRVWSVAESLAHISKDLTLCLRGFSSRNHVMPYSYLRIEETLTQGVQYHLARRSAGTE